MKPSRPIRGLITYLGWLLRIASLVVPQPQRQNWYSRRYAQVWHWAHFLHESGRLNTSTRLQLLKHVWAAFSDALWHRLNREKVLRFVRESPRTGRFCLLAISGLFLFCLLVTGFVPTVWSTFSQLPYRDPQHLAHFSFTNDFIRIRSDSLFLAASRWKGLSKTAEAVSAYSWEPVTLTAAPGGNVDVISARVSPDFLDTLGVGAGLGRAFRADDDAQCPRCVIMSDDLWRHAFHHDPAILGKQISLQGRPAIVVGVLPRQFRFVSPEISLWTLSDTKANAFTTAERAGVVLRLRPDSTMSQAKDEFSKLVSGTSDIDLTSIKDRAGQGARVYVVFTVLALVGSLVVLAYRLVNSSGPKVRLSLRNNIRWWMFFSAKTVLLLATCFVVSLEGTRRVFLMFNGVATPFAGPVSTWLFLVTTVLALTWSLHDQCHRCRLCLKRLGQEIHVGAPASLFLDWCGTELVCSQGHGMLHVPEMHASWLEMEHWTSLDDSWKSLFESEDVKA